MKNSGTSIQRNITLQKKGNKQLECVVNSVDLEGIILNKRCPFHNAAHCEPIFFVDVVQLLRCFWLFATLWTTALQVPLSSTISQSWHKFISIESVMHSYLIISYSATSYSFPLQYSRALGSSPMNQLLASSGQSTRASASVLLKNIQDLFPLGLTGLICLLSKWISRVFSRTTIQKHKFFSNQPSLWTNFYIGTWLLEKP